MMMKRIFFIILFISVFFGTFVFSASGLEKKGAVGFSSNTQPNQLVLKLNNGNIVLTADLDTASQVFTNFRLKIGNTVKSFNWKSIGNVSFAPSMKLIDLGNVRDAGIAITLVKAQGTGTYIQEIHVIRINGFTDLPVENPLNIIQKHMKIQNTDEGIIVNIDGSKTLLDKNYLTKFGIQSPFEKLIYDYRIVYGVVNKGLVVHIGLSNESLLYVGDIKIEYTYLNGSLVMKSIRFERLNEDSQ